MDFDFTDKTLHLTSIPPLGCLLRLSDEGSGFVQVLLDFGLQSGEAMFHLTPRGDRSPTHDQLVLRLMDRLRAFRVRMAGLIDGASQDRSSPQY